jgi:DNA-directed RNA polymerase subunit RPC12/RpoP
MKQTLGRGSWNGVAARKRSERRAAEREVKKDLERRDKLAALEVGGAPERPIHVATASLVDVMARDSKCHRCGGSVRLEEHFVRDNQRVARVRCSSCGSEREIFFAVSPRVLH